MRPGRDVLALLVLCVGGGGAQDVATSGRHQDDYDLSAGTFLFGKLVLVPVLAAIGLKFLALLPIVLSKIAVLSVMNFMSTNLNLLVSTLLGFKSFLGKYGLWAQEDPTRHPEIEAFSELANTPITMPAFRYQYLMDKEPMMGRIETNSISKPPKYYKVYNGFVPSDPGAYKLMFDRRTRVPDRRQVLKPKEQRSIGENGKYKCFWTTEDANTDAQLGAAAALGAAATLGSPSVKQEETEGLAKRNYEVADMAVGESQNYRQQADAYRDFNNGIGLSLANYAQLPNFFNYQSYPNIGSTSETGEQSSVYRQVATHGSAEKIDDGSGIRDGYGRLPFTADGQVKVAAENYGMLPPPPQPQPSTQQPLVYLVSESSTPPAAAKFKDDGRVK